LIAADIPPKKNYMKKANIKKYDMTGKRISQLTYEEYAYFAGLSLEKRRQIVFDNYLLIYPDTLYANQILIERSKKHKVTL
jgi:hypothetical protein